MPKGRVVGPEGSAELSVTRPPLGESGNRLVNGMRGSGMPGIDGVMVPRTGGHRAVELGEPVGGVTGTPERH